MAHIEFKDKKLAQNANNRWWRRALGNKSEIRPGPVVHPYVRSDPSPGMSSKEIVDIKERLDRQRNSERNMGIMDEPLGQTIKLRPASKPNFSISDNMEEVKRRARKRNLEGLARDYGPAHAAKIKAAYEKRVAEEKDK